VLPVQILDADLVWGPIVESRVKTLPIVEDLDVARNVPLGVPPCRVGGAMDTLVLQRPEKRLGQSIVVTNTGPAKRLPQIEPGEFLGELDACVLRTMPLTLAVRQGCDLQKRCRKAAEYPLKLMALLCPEHERKWHVGALPDVMLYGR